MPGEIFDFEWFVHNEGYNWLEADFSLDTVAPVGLPEGVGAGESIPWITVAGEPSSLSLLSRRRYYPLRDHSCLFRVFAETAIDPRGIVAFADRYGLLGVELESAPGRARPFIGTAEPISAWEREILSIRNALVLWDMVNEEDDQALERYLRPYVEAAKSDMEGGDASTGDIAAIAASAGELRWFRTRPEIPEQFTSGQLRQIALSRVQAIVNEHLGSRVSPRILWDDYQRGSWGLYFVPDSLAGAIWIQFAQAITENRDYRRCRQCDSWFEIDHYKARTNRYFCSNACRSKAYRERQQEARNLASTGMSVGDIAIKLGSDEETVARWIRQQA
ncbi:MAG: IS1 family transposase [Gaiellales bacterium]|nr:MAG: IS1 family transposase [Gaiellales bacterium]